MLEYGDSLVFKPHKISPTRSLVGGFQLALLGLIFARAGMLAVQYIKNRNSYIHNMYI